MAKSFSGWLNPLTGSGEVEPLVLPSVFGGIPDAHHTVMAVESAAYHGERIRRVPDDYPPKITELVEHGLRCSAGTYMAAMRIKNANVAQFARLGETFGLLIPATPGPPPDCTTTGNPIFNSPWSFLGFPVVSFPIGWNTDGLPLSLQLVGGPCSEDSLLRLANWCEARTGGDRPYPELM
jgi:aspartyl-tRNA(Asn)/glutamyl-tRNA(Gln) amidotransferase subunit A